MRILDVKLLRELKQSGGLLLAITSIVTIGVMCFVALQSAYRNLQQAKHDYYQDCHMADFWIDLKKAPVTELNQLASIGGVSEFRDRIQFSVTADLEGVSKPINGMALSLPDRRRPIINDIVMMRGDYFTNQRDNEVILNNAFAKAHNLKPGDWIHLLLNNRRQELFVVGTAISSEFTYLLGPGALVPDPKSFGVFYLKRTFTEEVFDFQGAANQIVGRWALDGSGESNDSSGNVVLDHFEHRLDDYGVFAKTPLKQQASNQFLSSEIDGLGAFASIVPAIFLAVAALILNVLMTRLARQQRTVVGTLKAIGYSDRQVFLHFLQFGMSVGILGGLAGSILGYMSASGMTSIYRQFFEFPDLQSRFYWHTPWSGNSVSVACAVAGCWYGAKSVLQLNPAAAMRPAPPKQGGAILLERLTWLWSQLDAGWRIALRTLFRHKLRTAAGVFAAAMGSSLLVNGFMMLESQAYLIDFQFHRTLRSDIDVTFESERGLDAVLELQSMEGVDYVEPTLNVSCNLVHGPYERKVSITGLKPDAQLTRPHNTDGQAVTVPTTGIVVTRRLADILRITAGDLVTAIPTKGDRRAVELQVSKISDSYMGLSVYANIHFLSRTIGEEFAVSGAQLTTTQDARQLNTLYEQLKNAPSIQAVSMRQDLIHHLTETLLQNQYVFIALIVAFAGAIFFGSIVNASIVNLAERQNEVATMRALGYGPWRIGLMFLRESVLTNGLGTLIGLPIGYFLVVLTAIGYNSDLFRLPIVTAPWIWIDTLLLAIAFALTAQGVVQWTILKMNFLEALKVKE